MGEETFSKNAESVHCQQFFSWWVWTVFFGVRGKCLMAQMWGHYINKNHPLSNSSLVDAVMLHHSVSYHPTLQHVDLYGKVND